MKRKFNFLNDEKRNRVHKITDRLNILFIGTGKQNNGGF